MTDHTTLAEALVEVGILVRRPDAEMYKLSDTSSTQGWKLADIIITDWRVAGKCLELCGESHLFWDDVDFGCTLRLGIGIHKGKGSVDGYARVGLPRAIIEAWYEARK